MDDAMKRSVARELVRSVDGGAARWPTRVWLRWLPTHLAVRFECVDDHAWGSMTRRDAPLWQQEVVEVFLAPVAVEDLALPPKQYIEIELSPRGTLFDAQVSNPDGERSTMRVDTAWDWPGIEWRAGQLGAARRQDWWAELILPWSGLVGGSDPSAPPEVLRANFYRVERPAGEAGPEDEFSAWSPTWLDPPDFHRPQSFGLLAPRSALDHPRLGRAVEAFQATGGKVWIVENI